MKKYFNRNTVICLIVSLALSYVYSLIFGYSNLNLINGLTFITAINAFIALIVYSRSKGDMAMFSYGKRGENIDYKNHRDYVIAEHKGKQNPFLGTFLILLVILIIIHQFNLLF